MAESALRVDHSSPISDVQTAIIDLPFRRLQTFARFQARHQSIVLVRLRTRCGTEGLGEAVTPCGPWWSGDSVETIRSMIDHYFAPQLLDRDVFRLSETLALLDRTARGNSFAKAAIEIAAMDLIGKLLGTPVCNLLGGRVRDHVAMAWPLASGDFDADVAEMDSMLERGAASAFKVKMGMMPIDEDLRRVQALAAAARTRGASLRIDPNEAWTEAEARGAFKQLEDDAIDLIEQPVPRWNLQAMARLRGSACAPLMLDESVLSPQDMVQAIRLDAGDVVSLKLMKAGGLMRTRATAQMADAAGITSYLGTFLETSIGTAASLHLGATLPSLPLGGETIGPLLLAQDIVRAPIRYADGGAYLPDGPGLGVELDEDRVKEYTRTSG
ncbi:MAG: muconate cycloisomerase family protein [Pseudomonadota bacterium]